MVVAALDRERYRAALEAQGRLWLEVDIGRQRLALRQCGGELTGYAISTARNGPGEEEGSNRTPRGWHVIRAKIGAGAPAGAVFVGRRRTGEVYSEALAAQFPRRDWVLSRILWLSGSEVGFNRLGSRDSMRRYVYFHGCPDRYPMGVPGSAGCIRMRNSDVIDLFDRVPAGTPVLIHE